MKHKMINILLFSAFITLISCDKSGTEDIPVNPPVEPPVEEVSIAGSYDSPYNRYSKGDKHIGQNNSAKVETIWSDTVWINDRVHKQLVLWSTQNEVSNIKYNITDLRSNSNLISASNITLREVTYVLGDSRALECGEQNNRQQVYIADALTTNVSNRLSTNDPLKLWITINIPKGTMPGLYEGTINVAQSSENQKDFNIKLLVTPNTLPDVKDWNFHLDIWQFPFQLPKLCKNNGVTIQPFSTEYETLMRPFYEMLADAGQKAVTTYIKDGAFNSGETMVKWNLDKNNQWSFDYTDFDKFVNFMFSLGIDKQINAFSPVGWNNSITYFNESSNKNETKTLEAGSEEYNNIWNTFLNSFKSHLSNQGWLDKTVIYLDEARNEETRKVVSTIRNNWEGWKIGLAGGEIDLDIERELYDYSTIFGYDRKSTNNTIGTFYTSCSQSFPNNYVTKETSPAEMVWMSWYAAGRGFNGYLRWAYDYWQNSDPLNIQDRTNTAGDFNMIYRTDNSSTSKPVGSIRFEMMRYGIQDYEKIKKLSNSQLNTLSRTVTSSTASQAKSTILNTQKVLKQISAQ